MIKDKPKTLEDYILRMAFAGSNAAVLTPLDTPVRQPVIIITEISRVAASQLDGELRRFAADTTDARGFWDKEVERERAFWEDRNDLEHIPTRAMFSWAEARWDGRVGVSFAYWHMAISALAFSADRMHVALGIARKHGAEPVWKY